MRSTLRPLLLLSLLWCLPLPYAAAQSGTSSALAETVTDNSGALVLRATVTATDVNTKAIRTGGTDASGQFLLSQINPGTYKVAVSSSGFGVASSQAMPVGVGRTITLNFTLPVSSAGRV